MCKMSLGYPLITESKETTKDDQEPTWRDSRWVHLSYLSSMNSVFMIQVIGEGEFLSIVIFHPVYKEW